MVVIGIPIESYEISENLFTASADPTTLFGEEILTRRLGVRLFAGSNKAIRVALLDENGQVLIPSSAALLKVRFSEAILFETLIEEISVTEYDPETGTAVFLVPDSVSALPGVYLTSLGVFIEDGTDTRLVSQKNLWVYNEPSVWADNTYSCALPAWEELKLLLRDSSPVENELLQKQFYDVEEVAQAAVETVRTWNDTPPYISTKTTQTFTYGQLWRLGIRYYLAEIVLEWMRKNRLPYSAGGITVDDMNKIQEYSVVQQQVGQEFRQTMLKLKVQRNIAMGFGKVG
ncbi:MAG TPA: hypothetical protein PKV43_01080 [Armatimonadota bacterium]|nr:hypothetical protein [Armatimonadota bacterium]